LRKSAGSFERSLLSLLHRLRQIPAWLLVGVVLAAVLVGLGFVSRPQAIEGGIYLQNAEVAGENIARGAIKNVVLPHVWDDEKPPWQGTARYRLTLPQTSSLPPDAQLALYIPRVGARYRVWLGGQIIASEHWETKGYVDTSVVPQLVALPPALLRQPLAANLIEIEVKGQLLRKSGLSQVIVGEMSALQARHARVSLWQVQATWMVGAASLLVALLCGLMWLQNRDKVFGLLAACSAAWALRLFLTPLVNPPMPFELWFYLHKLSFTVYCGFLYLFLWEIFEFRQGNAKRLIIALLLVGPIWLGITTYTENYNLYRIWTGIITLVSVVTLLMMFQRARWGLDANQRLMVVVGLATMITGVRDFAVVQLGLPGDGDIRWMTLGSLVFMLTLAWTMVQRTAKYMQQMGVQNQDLEARVAQKEAELRQAFDSLREAENRQILEAERERLTRDMHDGLGSQLVQTLNLVRSQSAAQSADPKQLEAMLGHALEELRMTLDSLEPMEGDLPAILGTLRQRISPALAAAGIELEWQVEEVPPVAIHGQPMEPRAVMQLFRALQEIFANIVKHAQAKSVTVRTWHEAPYVFLSVADDGVGLGAGAREGGRGMDNLRGRAAALGAELTLHSPAPDAENAAQAGQGTAVRLRFDCLFQPAIKNQSL
jgi:signal transduction histidine kinase